jgi:hypothetical protein
MPGKRLRFPPDDVADWHSVPIEEDLLVARKKLQDMMGRAYHISVWLEDEVMGPYYVRKGVSNDWRLQKTLYFFRDSEDAMMFAMRFS